MQIYFLQPVLIIFTRGAINFNHDIYIVEYWQIDRQIIFHSKTEVHIRADQWGLYDQFNKEIQNLIERKQADKIIEYNIWR